MSDVMDTTHVQKEISDLKQTRNLLAKIAPKKDSKLVTQLDIKLQHLWIPTI